MTIDAFSPTPWDQEVFGINTYELKNSLKETLLQASKLPGHYSVKVEPLSNKSLLAQYGFYYCDTLIEPFCLPERLCKLHHPDLAITQQLDWPALLAICHGAFRHGRFHRDFNLTTTQADTRYNNWLMQLYKKESVFGLLYQNELAGFIAHTDNKLLLHAISPNFRGRGLAKYWWSMVCQQLLLTQNKELVSSISASNMSVLNLYASLGFGFRNPQDIYHRLTH